MPLTSDSIKKNGTRHSTPFMFVLFLILLFAVIAGKPIVQAQSSLAGRWTLTLVASHKDVARLTYVPTPIPTNLTVSFSGSGSAVLVSDAQGRLTGTGSFQDTYAESFSGGCSGGGVTTQQESDTYSGQVIDSSGSANLKVTTNSQYPKGTPEPLITGTCHEAGGDSPIGIATALPNIPIVTLTGVVSSGCISGPACQLSDAFSATLKEGITNNELFPAACYYFSGSNTGSGDCLDIKVAGAFIGSTSPSSTSVQCIPNPVQALSKSTCTADVTGNTPTGGITFTSSNSQQQYTCTLESGSCSITFTGANYTHATTITAGYGGDANNQPSSGTVILSVEALTNPPTPLSTFLDLVTSTTGLYAIAAVFGVAMIGAVVRFVSNVRSMRKGSAKSGQQPPKKRGLSYKKSSQGQPPSQVQGWTTTQAPPPTTSAIPPSPIEGGGQSATGMGASLGSATVMPVATPLGPPLPIQPLLPTPNTWVPNPNGPTQVNLYADVGPGIEILKADGQVIALNTNQTSAFLDPGDSIRFTLNPPNGWTWFQR